ncbi:MAG: tetratricopeptide repeat protein [Candidatus Omnitrophica bacterium]|nr:tetratricopeptide repeat protein [Candidatus Omnitrophota bacterium]
MRFARACYLFVCDLKQALKELRIIIDCMPHDEIVRCKNGEGLICVGKVVEGLKQFEIAISMNEGMKGNIEAWKGEMYLMMGEYKKALKSLEIAVQLNAPLALCWRGAALFKSGHIQEGLKDLRHVVKKFPKDREARVWMAEILRTLGKFNESFEHLNFILKSSPDYDFAFFNRALLYYETGDYTSMLEDFSRIDIKLKSVILDRLKIKPITKFSHGQIYKILKGGLEMAKGNRRHEKYFLRIQFPVYTNIG